MHPPRVEGDRGYIRNKEGVATEGKQSRDTPSVRGAIRKTTALRSKMNTGKINKYRLKANDLMPRYVVVLRTTW